VGRADGDAGGSAAQACGPSVVAAARVPLLIAMAAAVWREVAAEGGGHRAMEIEGDHIHCNSFFLFKNIGHLGLLLVCGYSLLLGKHKGIE
jgi:hypothetical protein